MFCSQVDLNRVKIFLEIVKAGNISKAANILRLQKSKLSRDLTLLEQELGTQLIYRTTRQFSLTREGQAFFEKVNSGLRLLDEAISSTSASSKNIAGHISITSPEDIGQIVLLPCLEEFSKLYPEITYNIIYSTDIIDLIKNKVDLAIRAGRLKDSSLKMRKLGEVEHGIYCSSNFFDKTAKDISLTDLTNLPLVHFRARSAKPVWELESKTKFQKIEIKPIVSVNSYTAALDLVNAGLGIGLLPKFVARNDVLKGRLIQLLKKWSTAPATLQIVYPPKNEEILRVQVLRDFLVKKFSIFF